jgi:SAM-dependent methyltransferase
MTDDLPELPADAFARWDTGRDPLFYAVPRFVTHIDDQAIAAVTALYRRLFPPGGAILDLMSSWVSHLPEEIAFAEVVGHGLNRAELAANPRLTRFFVQDLNEDPRLPLDTDAFDGVGLCVSIQYLRRPVTVLREVARVLKPGAPVAITFSNRCFPTKAVAIWRAGGDDAHRRLVREYLERTGFTAVSEEAPPTSDDPLFVVWARRPERP